MLNYHVKTVLRGLVKLKKSKNQRKTRIGQTTPTPDPFFFWKHENNTKNIKFPTKNLKSECGLDTHTHLQVFLCFFFNLTKPLSVD